MKKNQSYLVNNGLHRIHAVIWNPESFKLRPKKELKSRFLDSLLVTKLFVMSIGFQLFSGWPKNSIGEIGGKLVVPQRLQLVQLDLAVVQETSTHNTKH